MEELNSGGPVVDGTDLLCVGVCFTRRTLCVCFLFYCVSLLEWQSGFQFFFVFVFVFFKCHSLLHAGLHKNFDRDHKVLGMTLDQVASTGLRERKSLSLPYPTSRRARTMATATR